MKKEASSHTTKKQRWNDSHAPVTFFLIPNKIMFNGVQS